jgi:hypothetical protein
MLRRMQIAALGAVAVLLLAGCGESAQEKAAKASKKQALVVEANHRKAVAKAEAEYHQCQARVGPFIKSLNELKGHIEIGLNENDYTSRVGDVQVARKELPEIGEISLHCGEAMLGAMKANVEEVKAAEYWSSCVESLACDEAAKKRTIQADWPGRTRS